MKYSKKRIITVASIGTLGAVGIGATAIAATSGSSSGYPPIVQKIASTFGLAPARVNDVFVQQHQVNHQDREARLKGSLDQAVKDGKLTTEQENNLIDELNKLHQQAKTNRHDIKSQLEQWAKDNGISNLDQILPHPPAGMHHWMGMMPDNDTGADDN